MPDDSLMLLTASIADSLAKIEIHLSALVGQEAARLKTAGIEWETLSILIADDIQDNEETTEEEV